MLLTSKANLLQHQLAKQAVRIIMGITLLFACSQLSIPIEPVPITLQTVGVMLVALLYRMRDSMYVITAYLAAGAIGLPVFSGYKAGIAVLFGVTGGYFFGFWLCIYAMNKMKKYLNTQTAIGIFLNCIIGTVIIFACGISWLATYLGMHDAIKLGLLPFILPGIAKAFFLTGFLRTLGIVRSLRI